MFCIFLSFASCVHNKFPITRYSCGAIINTSYYNLAEWESSRKAESFKDPKTGGQFYLKMCGSFTQDEVPSYWTDYKHYALALCYDDKKQCYPLASRFSQDYRPLNEKNFDEGVIVDFDGEPNPVLSEYLDWKAVFEVSCDLNQKDPKITITPTISQTPDKYGEIRYKFSFYKACPERAALPTPTPAYNPQCDHDARDPNTPTIGVDVNLRDLNAGAGGIMWKSAVDGQNKIFFVQPCERMTCPYGAQCNSKNGLSSIWVCNEDVTSCNDSGIIDDHTRIDTDPKHLHKNTTVDIFDGTTGKAQLLLECDNGFFQNHLNFLSVKYWPTMLLYEFYAKTPEVCVQSLPVPQPDDEKFCAYQDREGKRGVKLDASIHDVQGGYIIPGITINGETIHHDNTLYYQPCSGIYCPPNANCDQFEDAFIWLCRPITSMHDNMFCDPYGLFEKGITMMRNNPFNLEEGINIKYKGGDDRSAIVTYACDEKLEKGKIKLPTSVNITKRVMHFTVYSKDVCPVNMQTITGGGIFLILVIGGLVAYFGIGTLYVFIRNNEVSIPNKEFWIEFIACLTTSFAYIKSCGKQTSLGDSSYETVN